jgi:ribosomal protein S18 acetylase RimI-like enzyme
VIESDHAWLLVADDGGIIGTVIAGWDGWRASLYRLAVDPGRRREGIARALVEAAEDRLTGAGARKILAIVIREHDHAFGFWHGIGYEEDPRLARFAKTIR